MAIHECPIPGCGRRFKDDSQLDDHVRRRHGEQPANLRDISNMASTEDNKAQKVDKAVLKKKKAELLAQEKDLQEELSKLDEKEEEVKFTMNDILESQKRLTTEYLLQKSGCNNLEDITQLILREENLYHFDDTSNLFIDDLANLEYLALSHNKLTVVNGIGKLANLIELNINFNLVEDITPLNECLNLEKLYASNNKIKHISGLRDLTRLKCLGLFKNKLTNFDETAQALANFPALQELDLEGNPCTRKFTYKYDLLYYVKVEKLDGERVSEIDYELARSFKGEDAAYEVEEEEQKTNTAGPLQRPSTAPGRVRPEGNFANKLKRKMNVGNMGNVGPLGYIPENVNSEKLAELEQENDSLKDRINALEVELEETRGKERIMQLENDKLTNQINILKVEANNAYILMDNNQQLKKELQSLKTIFSNKIEPKDSKQDNILLQEQIVELVKENNELKAKLEKQKNAELDIEERLARKKERLTIDSRNSSVSQEGRKSTQFMIRTGPVSPKTTFVKVRNNSATNIAKPVRGNSTEPKKAEEPVSTRATPEQGSARKIIGVKSGVKVVVPRQNTPTLPTKPQEELEDEPLDDEIEALLVRNSLQLSQLRSELRDFDFISTKNAKNVEKDIEGDDDNGDDDGHNTTQDTSVQLSRSSQRRY